MDGSQQAMVSALSSASSRQRNDYPDFFPAAQRDFAARLKWSVTSKYTDANHAPVIQMESPFNVLASAKDKIKLHVAVSDPDGNKVAVKWWQFRGDDYDNEVAITNAASNTAEILIPNGAVGQTIHIIVEATDNGEPALTTYKRVIITVRNL